MPGKLPAATHLPVLSKLLQIVQKLDRRDRPHLLSIHPLVAKLLHQWAHLGAPIGFARSCRPARKPAFE